MRPEDLRGRRARAGITVARLAELSGISESTIGRIENGYTGATARTLRQLERALSGEQEACRELLEAAKAVLQVYQQRTDAPDWLIHEMAALLGAVQNFEARG